jgi:hypothetical protein
MSEVMCIAKKAEFFILVCGDDDDLAVNKWIPCRSEEPGALRRTMQEPAMGGIAFQVRIRWINRNASAIFSTPW